MIPRSLRARVTVVGVVTLALVLSTGGWLTVRALAAALRSDTRAQNEEVLEALAEQIASGADPRLLPVPIGADGTEFLIIDSAERLLNASFVPYSAAQQVPISDTAGFLSSGPIVFASEQEMIDFFSSAPPNVVVFPDVVTGERPLPVSNDWFETRHTITAPDGEELTLVALSPFGVVSRSIDRLTVALALIVPLVAVLGGGALWLAIGSALRPVQRISDEAKRIAPSNSGDRLPVPDSANEIADLTETLNDMLDRLDAGLIRQRQFIADASHELRSPLTAVKGATELVVSNDDLPSRVAPSLQALTSGVARLESVLDDLTELAIGGATAELEEVDLADVVMTEVLATTATSSRGQELTMTSSGVSPAVVLAHPVRLGRAIHNLLDNARRHATAEVSISTIVDGDEVRIIVDDDGPGVPVADRQRVFERFVRLDDARTRERGGSGLGLALVASIAEDHNGTVTCEVSPLGGARFVLSF